MLAVGPHGRTAYGAFVHFLLVPFAASDALVVPFLHLFDARLTDRPIRYLQDPRGVLYGVIVREDGATCVQSKCQHSDVDR